MEAITPSSFRGKVETFTDFFTIGRQLVHENLIGKEKDFAVLVGCSSHSPIPKPLIPQIASLIGDKILVPHQISILWGGGDPFYKKPERGGNVSDLKFLLIEQGFLQAGGAIQRTDWIKNTPQHDSIRVEYTKQAATIEGGEVTFGGFHAKPPVNYKDFLSKMNDSGYQSPLLPSIGNEFFPVAASAGYLMVFPAMSKQLVFIIIAQAGMISFQELEYLNRVLSQHPDAPILVYGISWKGIGNNLNGYEKKEKCKLDEITHKLKTMNQKFPSRVKLLKV